MQLLFLALKPIMEKFKCVPSGEKRNGFVVIAFDFSLHILILPSVVHLKVCDDRKSAALHLSPQEPEGLSIFLQQ